MNMIKAIVIVILSAVIGVGLFIYSGTYPIGADVPHNKVEYWLLETLRNKAIERSSKDILVPALDSPDLLLMGGVDYNDMCSACHLKPGKTRSDMSLGLYPTPPNLATNERELELENDDKIRLAQRQFWVIKHGIKASGMPAWGPTHEDERIWAMVAFLQQLPELTAEQYNILTARDPKDNQEMAH
ncbi:c-type cytochrome [Aliiglaciecola lipolytica]|uniref:Cytochrome c family protein n=1 Tax=Aliiglaciecola lipolytica E3 TaxID=1127673 RepID=K6Z084_9ALTE|nr:cytochrome c [Aliiglaciecola lipolytica]GAC16860.1 cytochrome c family protein [Aliiglaciecola lipolytica E3]